MRYMVVFLYLWYNGLICYSASLPHHNCGKGHKYKEQYKEMLEKNETTARSGDMGGAEVGGIPSTTSSSAGSASEGADVSLPHKRSVGDRDE